MKQTGAALAAFAATPSFLVRAARAQMHARPDRDRPIVIAIFQRGAADGISMVVPFADRHYYAVRQQIAIPEPTSYSNECSIDLDGFYALHPALAPLKSIYDEGHLAIVHGVGSSNGTRSHFDAQNYMESGTPGNKNVADGWLNRFLQFHEPSSHSPFRGVAFGPNTPRALMGAAPAVALTRLRDFGIHGAPASDEIAATVAPAHEDMFGAAGMSKGANPRQYSPATRADYPQSDYGQALLQIAQLVKANAGLDVAFADIGGWDTHANQGAARGQMANRLQEFAQGLAALYRDLGDRMRNVVVLTMTEFGRSIRPNGSGGTDHGHASCLFVVGGPVKGGRVYGRWPGLAPELLYEGRDLAVTTDFREVFAEILAKHMKARHLDKVFPEFQPAAPLNLL